MKCYNLLAIILSETKRTVLVVSWTKVKRKKREFYIRMRTMARPTADIDTRVPMQYFITSYFAASNWAFNAWISCKEYQNAQVKITDNTRYKAFHVRSHLANLTRSSLVVRSVVSAFCLANSSRMRLHLLVQLLVQLRIKGR